MKSNIVGWFEIYVEDMPRAKVFYESVFNRKLERLESPEIEMWSFGGDINLYGSPGALVKMPEFPAGNNSILIYFSCADCKVEEQLVIKFGGKVQKEKFSIGKYGFISLVFDTEGNMFGLHSLK